MLSGLEFGSLHIIIKSKGRFFSIVIVTVVKISGNSCPQSLTLASFNADKIPFLFSSPAPHQAWYLATVDTELMTACVGVDGV